MERMIFIFLVLLPAWGMAGESDFARKEKLLDRAKDALIWFQKLDSDAVRKRTPAASYRNHLSPSELIQSLAVLVQLKQKETGILAEDLSEMLLYYRMTSEECYLLQEEFGETLLPKLAEAGIAAGFIYAGAEAFINDERNNAEKLVLHKEPENAWELMKAVDVLSVTGRPALVRHYLRKFLKEKEFAASPAESARIAETVGSQRLLQIAVNPSFDPLGKETVAKIMENARKHWQDSGKIAEALEEDQWFTNVPAAQEKSGTNYSVPGSVHIRAEAKPSLQILWKGDPLSIPQAVNKLSKIEDKKESDELCAVILSISKSGKEILAAAAQSGQPQRYPAARGLAAAVSRQDIFLLYEFLYDKEVPDEQKESVAAILKQRQIPILNKEEAAFFLYRRGMDYLEHRRPIRADAEGNVAVWEMPPATENPQEIRSRMIPLAEAYPYFSYKYCRSAYRIEPERTDYRLMSGIAFLESIPGAGKDVPFKKTFTDHEFSHEFVQQILKTSLENGYNRAAVNAASMLQISGTAELLRSSGGKPRPLVQAVAAKDRRVRFAALETIMSFNPAEPFAGSSLVVDTLLWFAKSDGKKKIAVGHIQFDKANQTASMLMSSGYQTELATNCADLFRIAAASPDVEFVFTDARCPMPVVGEFVQKMRQDARTAEIPIAVLTSEELDPRVNLTYRRTMDAFDRLNPNGAFRHSLSLTYPSFTDKKSAEWVRNDLRAKSGIDAVPPAVRLVQAKKALDWIKEIVEQQAGGKAKVFDIPDLESAVLDAVHSEERIEKGLELAAAIKSATLQLTLYNTAANLLLPMEIRKSAADDFRANVSRFGVLLRGKQIQMMYDRYNAAEKEPKESLELLSELIDIVETAAVSAK
ncbi:MAG: hypothetical protein LBH00_01095 [Planctomycetaceae bacterium]|jgi:hypothetical protein|nr:hypothetical protein [Planctomycetaceae bacterium]